MPQWGAWHRTDLQYVRSQGTALIRHLPVHARETMRYYEVAAVLLPFKPMAPLDAKAASLPKKTFFYFVVSDWTLHVCSLTAEGKMIKLELPWLAIQRVDRSPSLEPFLDTSGSSINEHSEGIRIEQMLLEDPDDKDIRFHDGTDSSTTTSRRRSWLFGGKSSNTSTSKRGSKKGGAKGLPVSNALVAATVEEGSCLFFHIWRAWIGAHMRVALHQSRIPETPHWFMPPMITTKSLDAAALGLDRRWHLDASNDFQWHYAATFLPYQFSKTGSLHEDDEEPTTPRSQIVSNTLDRRTTPSTKGSASPGYQGYRRSANKDNAILRWSPPRSGFGRAGEEPQSAIKAFMQSGALHSPIPAATSPFTKSMDQTLMSPSMSRLRDSGLDTYGRQVTACKQKLSPSRGNYLMAPSKDDLMETNTAFRDLEAELCDVQHCLVLDMRDVTWLRELAQESSFCSSSLSRELQAALFTSKPFMTCLVKKLSYWGDICTMYGDGGACGPLSRSERLEYESGDAMKANSMRVSMTLREQRMQAREMEEQESLEQLHRSSQGSESYGLPFASRVGQGHHGLSHIISHMRRKKLLLRDEDENDQDEGRPGLHAETSRASPGAKSTKTLRDSWRTWSQPGTPAPQTPSGTRRRRGGQSAVEIGRRWEALVGRMMAVTAWQKSRVMLLALHKTLQFSEGCPVRLQWMSEDEVIHLDGDDQPPSTWRDATLSLVVLLLQLHTPLHESSPILQYDLNIMANQDRLNGPMAGLWWCTSDTDSITLDLIVSCLFDLFGLGIQNQAMEKSAWNDLLLEIAELPYETVHSKLCGMFMRLTSLMLDPNPPALGFEEAPTPQELLSALAFRYATVLLWLLRALPDAQLCLHEEYEEEIKYILWDEVLPQPPVFGLGSGQFLCYVNDSLYREVIHTLLDAKRRDDNRTSLLA